MSELDVETEGLLRDAQRRGRRRVVVRRSVASVAIAIAVVAVVASAPAILDALRNQQREPATTPSPLPITGTYTTTITPQDPGSSKAPGSVGTWLLTLGGGQLELASLTNGHVGRSLTQYQVTQSELLISVLDDGRCTGVGRYSWSRSGSSLTFVVVDDPCPLRVAVFSSHPWTPA